MMMMMMMMMIVVVVLFDGVRWLDGLIGLYEVYCKNSWNVAYIYPYSSDSAVVEVEEIIINS